jgi:hypothetical protein
MPQREERALAFPDGFARSVGPFGAPNVSSALSGALAAMIAIDGYADATGMRCWCSWISGRATSGQLEGRVVTSGRFDA